ncbi:amidase [candidate division MSBL1 archaeon SCGC-AAA261F19]|uniref:Amidase n=1 Tax=candidate division MSBL1 archaeon SCGC-AAA261F19 TaxID=1698275 RepID=A0A133V6E8_9EURY|nr:amidase [candidate division MSBL1 archaeon SCGC-AAA261F19]
MSALEISNAIKREELSPIEVIDALIEHIKEYNPKINAIVTLAEDKARKSAKKVKKALKEGKELGPLSGVPLTVKDLESTKGIRTTFGSKLFENNVPEEDTIVVERSKKAGAVILGKTNTPEFGMIAVTDNLLFGHTRNPWDLSRTCGGSSGGSAAGVAAGMGPVATGSDAGGSIRIPSSLCGVYGMKPSFGRIPSYPSLPGWETMSCEGPITRTVSDAALIMDVMAGPDSRDRFSLPSEDTNYLESLNDGIDGSKIAYSPDLGYAAVDPEVEKVTQRASSSFEELNCEVSEVELDIPDMERELLTVMVSEAVTAFEDILGEGWEEKIYPLYNDLLSTKESLTFKDYVRVQFKRKELWEKMREIFENYDFLLTPATAVPAFEIEERGPLGPEKVNGKNISSMGWIPFTYPFNFTGQPAASIPCGFSSEGLPIGLQIVGDRYDDLGVLQASRAYEKAFPWNKKRPPLT